MVKLSNATLGDLSPKVATPPYDRASLTPGIMHIGVGNFHRAHQAVYLDRLFAKGLDHDWALVGAGVMPGDTRMRAALAAQDWLTTVVELDPDGLSARVTGAMVDFCDTTPDAIIARLGDPAIRIVSLTVTEGGYFVTPDGAFDTNHPAIKADAADPAHPKTVFGILIAALKNRRDAGQAPFTVMSCDNLPENGHVAKQAVTGLAQLIDPDLASWIEASVAFPCGMVDCITPATSDRERWVVKENFGVEDAVPVTCEPFRQWVLEDHFPQGRPAFEEVGVEFVDDVAPYELMKLRILNGGHAAIAYPGALLGHTYVHDAMNDPDIRGWLMHLERAEVIPTVPTIPGVDFDTYLQTCANRFSNHVVADTIPRLCLDGSNRQPKFILPTLTAALAQDRPIEGLALETALWCRYCAGTMEDGTPITLQDERAEHLNAAAMEARTNPQAFLNIRDVFGDLAANDRYASAFAGHVKALWQDGTRAVLQRYHAGS